MRFLFIYLKESEIRATLTHGAFQSREAATSTFFGKLEEMMQIAVQWFTYIVFASAIIFAFWIRAKTVKAKIGDLECGAVYRRTRHDGLYMRFDDSHFRVERQKLGYRIDYFSGTLFDPEEVVLVEKH